jgi:hypothetical protein
MVKVRVRIDVGFVAVSSPASMPNTDTVIMFANRFHFKTLDTITSVALS